MRWRAVSGWPPSPKAAASRAGCIGVGPVPSSSGKPSMNGRPARFGLVSGRGNIMTGNATRATAIKRRFDPWPINGYASTSAAGEIGWPTPRSATWKRGALAPPRRTRQLTWWPVQNRVWAAASGHREERFRRGRPPEVSDDYRDQGRAGMPDAGPLRQIWGACLRSHADRYRWAQAKLSSPSEGRAAAALDAVFIRVGCRAPGQHHRAAPGRHGRTEI